MIDGKMTPVVIGEENCPQTHLLCDWLTRQGEKFVYSNRSEFVGGKEVYFSPTIITDRGTQSKATPAQAAELLGYKRFPKADSYDVVVIGSGPAGLSAAIHGAAEGLSTLAVESYAIGGQMSSSQHVENYAGFPNGISGTELAIAMAKQAERLGAEILVATSVTAIKPQAGWPGYLVQVGNDLVYAKVVILALGSQFRTIDIAGEEHFLGTGVYYGMTARDTEQCGQDVVVIGSGNSAGQAAIAFATKGKKVTMVVRSETLEHGMSAYLVKEVSEHPNIEIKFVAQVKALEGSNGRLNNVELEFSNGLREHLACESVFVFAGNAPETNWLGDLVQRDKSGHIETSGELLTACRKDSIFAIGDVRSGSTKRIAVAAAEGAEAAAKAWEIVKGGR